MAYTTGPDGRGRLFFLGGKLVVVSKTEPSRAYRFDQPHDPPDLAGFFDEAPLFSRTLTRSQREAGDFFPYDGCDIVLLSERQNVWLLGNRS